jgi:hypothetical protein
MEKYSIFLQLSTICEMEMIVFFPWEILKFKIYSTKIKLMYRYWFLLYRYFLSVATHGHIPSVVYRNVTQRMHAAPYPPAGLLSRLRLEMHAWTVVNKLNLQVDHQNMRTVFQWRAGGDYYTSTGYATFRDTLAIGNIRHDSCLRALFSDLMPWWFDGARVIYIAAFCCLHCTLKIWILAGRACIAREEIRRYAEWSTHRHSSAAVASESIHPTSVSWPHAKDISSRPTHIHVGFAGRGSE